MSAVLFTVQRDRMRRKAEEEVGDARYERENYDPYNEVYPGAFSPNIDAWRDPRRRIRRTAFGYWSLPLAATAGGLAGLSGTLTADVRPLTTRRAQKHALIGGGIALGAGAAAWLVGRARKVPEDCFWSLPDVGEGRSCFDPWFETNAAFMISGTSLISAGAFFLAWGAQSRTRFPLPAVTVRRTGATLSLSGRF